MVVVYLYDWPTFWFTWFDGETYFSPTTLASWIRFQDTWLSEWWIVA